MQNMIPYVWSLISCNDFSMVYVLSGVLVKEDLAFSNVLTMNPTIFSSVLRPMVMINRIFLVENSALQPTST